VHPRRYQREGMKMRVRSEESKEKDNIRRRKKYDEGMAILHRYKLIKGCKICKYKEHAAALEFDHVNPKDKKFEIAKRAHYLRYGKKTKSNKKIKEEIFKCQVLCSNCHSIRTNTEEHYGIKKLARV
jgi:5-methylcytosine-specific restriction endonuclease McrA